jgi:hypothetical protein
MSWQKYKHGLIKIVAIIAGIQITITMAHNINKSIIYIVWMI